MTHGLECVFYLLALILRLAILYKKITSNRSLPINKRRRGRDVLTCVIEKALVGLILRLISMNLSHKFLPRPGMGSDCTVHLEQERSVDIIHKKHRSPYFRFRLLMQGITDFQPHWIDILEQDLDDFFQSVPLYSNERSHFLSFS